MNKKDLVFKRVTEVSVYYSDMYYNEVLDWIGCSRISLPEYDSEYKRNYVRRRQVLDLVFGREESYKMFLELNYQVVQQKINTLGELHQRLDECWNGSEFMLEHNLTHNDVSPLEDLDFYVCQMRWAIETPLELGEELGYSEYDIIDTIGNLL